MSHSTGNFLNPLSFVRQENSDERPSAPPPFASSPGAINCGAVRLTVSVADRRTARREKRAARLEGLLSGVSAPRLAPMARPFLVVAGVPSVSRIGDAVATRRQDRRHPRYRRRPSPWRRGTGAMYRVDIGGVGPCSRSLAEPQEKLATLRAGSVGRREERTVAEGRRVQIARARCRCSAGPEQEPVPGVTWPS